MSQIYRLSVIYQPNESKPIALNTDWGLNVKGETAGRFLFISNGSRREGWNATTAALAYDWNKNDTCTALEHPEKPSGSRRAKLASSVSLH